MQLSYPIYIENDFNTLGDAFRNIRQKACIVTDSHVAPLYLKAVIDALSPAGLDISSVQFEAGEAQKHLDTVSHLYDAFTANRLDRGSVVIALGGGVTGDMAGFAAATYMRGIPFVQVPTTLLSQVDASVGGKTAVDYRGIKNLVGAFYQPRFVYINLDTLHTLSENDYRSGMGEVIKHGLIDGGAYQQYLFANKQDILARDGNALREIVTGSCRIKAAVVAADEKESVTGGREILNLGHTFGHAAESLTGYTLPHGCCVGIGLCAALYMSNRMGHADIKNLHDTEALLTYFGLPTRVPALSPDDLYRTMLTDKKTKNGTLRLVLINEAGHAYTEENAPESLIKEALRYITDTL